MNHQVTRYGKLDSKEPRQQEDDIVEIEQKKLRMIAETICTQSRYPLLALRLLIYVITGIDENGRIDISARHLSKKMDVHYDTITKCLKYLRETEILRIIR